MKNKIFKLFTLFIFFILNFTFIWVEAFSGDIKNESIWELKNNIKILSKKEIKVNNSWEKFLKNNWWIRDFLRKDLKKSEINKILFLEKKSNIWENKRKKIEFYKKLYPYIDLQKKEKFFNYIKEEIKKLEQKKDIKKIIVEKKEILKKKEQKYEKIKEKKEKYYFDVVLKNTIRKKIKQKLQEIENKDSFKRLLLTRKIFLYKTFIDKIKQKKKNLLNQEQTKKITRKILILDILAEELQNFIDKISIKIIEK